MFKKCSEWIVNDKNKNWLKIVKDLKEIVLNQCINREAINTIYFVSGVES